MEVVIVRKSSLAEFEPLHGLGGQPQPGPPQAENGRAEEREREKKKKKEQSVTRPKGNKQSSKLTNKEASTNQSKQSMRKK